jgi:endonuclease III
MDLGALCEGYLQAKRVVIDRGFEDEIRWQLFRDVHTFNEQDFLREASWVVLSAGFSDRVVRSIFPRIAASFFEWESAVRISNNKIRCKKAALKSFRNERKINAIVEIAQTIAEGGFDSLADSIRRGDPSLLYELPYLGPATAAHLMKNLGVRIAKPDRHLLRIAKAFSYKDVNRMCGDIAHRVGDNVAEVDLVLWRYATLDQNYLEQLHVPLLRQWELA